MLCAGTYVHMCIHVNRYIIYIYHIVYIQFYNLGLHIKYILYIIHLLLYTWYIYMLGHLMYSYQHSLKS